MKRKRAVPLAATVVVLAALAGLAWVTRPKDMAAEEAAARTTGLILSPSEFPQPAVPPADDAAPLYKALQAVLKRRPLTREEERLLTPYRRAGDAPVTASQRRALLTKRKEELALAHAAAAKPAANFPLGFTAQDSIGPLTVPLHAVETASGLLLCESRLAADEGRYLDAVQGQATALRAAAQPASWPTGFGAIEACTGESAALRGLGDILAEGGNRSGVAAAVRSVAAGDGVRISFPRIVQAETLEGLAVISDHTVWEDIVRSGLPRVARWAAPAIGAPVLGTVYLEGNAADYLHWMSAQLKAATQPLSARPGAFDKVKEAMDRQNFNPYHFYAGMLTPNFEYTARLEVENAARRAVLTAAASVLEYHGRTGAFPARLSDAMPAPPPDPWTGKPLGYRREGHGFVVYSAGEKSAVHAAPSGPDTHAALFRYPETNPRPTP